MRSKKLHYSIDITPPLNKMNIIPTDEEIEKINEKPENSECPKEQPHDISSTSTYVSVSVKG